MQNAECRIQAVTVGGLSNAELNQELSAL